MKRPGAWLTAACLLLLALNLRPLFPSTAILLPELKQALHLSGAQAGYLTTLPVLCMGLFAPFAPRLAQRASIERTLALTSMILGPRGVIWPLALIQGVGQGGLFALAMMLIVLRSGDAHVAAHLSSMSQTTGYVLAAGGPLLIGVLHDWTGDFRASTGLVAALGLCTALAGWAAGRNALVRATVVRDRVR